MATAPPHTCIGDALPHISIPHIHGWQVLLVDSALSPLSPRGQRGGQAARSDDGAPRRGKSLCEVSTLGAVLGG